MKPPKECNICKAEHLLQYVDGQTTSGRWADMCMECHFAHGIGLGLGIGQTYEWNASKKGYIQTAGGTQKGRAF